MGNPTVVLALGGGVVVLILIIAVISIRSQRADVVEERLGRYTEASTFMTLAEDEAKTDEKKPSALSQQLDSVLSRRSFAAGWRAQLQKADLKLTVSEFFGLHILSMVAVGIICY